MVESAEVTAVLRVLAVKASGPAFAAEVVVVVVQPGGPSRRWRLAGREVEGELVHEFLRALTKASKAETGMRQWERGVLLPVGLNLLFKPLAVSTAASPPLPPVS